jgi:hypothetical protein
MGFVSWVRTQWDRAAAVAALLIGVVSLLLGWIGVSGTSYVAKQIPYVVSGALFGVFMIGIAAAIWLSADLRDEWRELRGIRLELRAQTLAAAGHNPYGDPAADTTGVIPAVAEPVGRYSGIG